MIYLKPLEKADVTPFRNWIKDDEVIQYSLSVFQDLKTSSQISSWYAAMLRSKNSFQLGIFLIDSDELIGYAGFSGISKQNNSAEFFLFIGDKNYWGKGIASKVTKQVIQIGFQELKLHRIMLTVSEPNIFAVKTYKKAGFKLEGKLRDACLREGIYHDKLVYGLLNSEWSANNLSYPTL